MFNWYQIIMTSHYLNLPSPILLMSSMWFIILQNKMHRIQQLECPRSLLIRLVFIRLNKDGHSFYVQFTNRVTLDDVTNRNIFRVALLALCAVHRSPLNSPHNGQWRGALMFSLICAWIKRLSKQSWGWWFETPSCSLWRLSVRLVLQTV